MLFVALYIKNMEYLQKAKDFLRKNEISLTIREAIPQTPPLWVNEDKPEEYGIKYWVTLENRKTGKRYGFDFWNSIDAKEHNRRPNAYDFLACLDTYSDGDTFEDFCSTYGYETDSRKALKTYNTVMKQNEGLKNVFNEEQLNQLNEIN